MSEQEKRIIGRMGVRRQARTMSREHRGSGSRGLSAQSLKNFRLNLPTVATKYHLRRPDNPFPQLDNPELLSYEKVGMQYFIKRGKNKMRMIELTPGRDLIDVYRFPDKKQKLEDGSEIAIYEHLVSSEKAQQAIIEGKWLKEFEPDSYYGVSGWVEEWHHLVTMEKISGDYRRGDVRKKYDKNDKTSGSFFKTRDRCETTLGQKTCDLCKEGWPKVFGNRFWVDLSHGRWFGPVDAQQEVLERQPTEGGYVFPLYYACEHCNEMLSVQNGEQVVSMDIALACAHCGAHVDPEAGTDPIGIDHEHHLAKCLECNEEWPLLSHDDPEGLRKLLVQDHECANCKEKTYPMPVYQHIWVDAEDQGKEALTEWTTHDIWDCQVTMLVDGKNLVIKRCLVQEPDPRLFDPKFQGLESLGKEGAEQQAERMREELDLNKVHAPVDPDEVAEFLDLPNLFEHAAAQKEASAEKQRYRPRGQASS